MSGKIQGKNVILSLWDGAAYAPMGCATNVTIDVDTEIIPITTNDSGVWRTFKPRINEWGITCEGVTIIQGASLYLPLDTILEQIRMAGVNIEIEFTDPDAVTQTITGEVLITNTSIDSNYGDFSNFSFTAKGNGEFTIDAVSDPVASTNVMTIEFTGDGVTTSFADADLIGRTIHLAFIDHYEWKIITAGTPAAEEVKYTSGTGTMSFLTAPAYGVRIKFLYE